MKTKHVQLKLQKDKVISRVFQSAYRPANEGKVKKVNIEGKMFS